MVEQIWFQYHATEQGILEIYMFAQHCLPAPPKKGKIIILTSTSDSISQFDEFRRRYALMIFEGTSMLHKAVPTS